MLFLFTELRLNCTNERSIFYDIVIYVVICTSILIKIDHQHLANKMSHKMQILKKSIEFLST